MDSMEYESRTYRSEASNARCYGRRRIQRVHDEKCNVLVNKSTICHVYAEYTCLPEADTPRRKKIRRLSFIVDSCYLFITVIILENSRFICRGIICLFYEVLHVNRTQQSRSNLLQHVQVCVRLENENPHHEKKE